jgi:hypothetical protein
VNGTVEEQGLDLGRLYGDLPGMGIGRHMGLEQVDNQVGAEWQADEWIPTSVWILEAIGGGHQEGVANLRSVGQRIRPSVYTAYVSVRRETAPH